MIDTPLFDGGAGPNPSHAACGHPVVAHGDHHDLWIAPDDANRLIIGDDGGAQVSYDAGASWSTYQNQPTAQFYRVTTDDHFPYRIYGAQQDNSTVRIRSRSTGAGIGKDDWESTAGGESGWSPRALPQPSGGSVARWRSWVVRVRRVGGAAAVQRQRGAGIVGVRCAGDGDVECRAV